MVECRICNREVAGSNLSLGYFAPRSTQPSIPPGSVNEYQLRLGRQRQVWLIPFADEMQHVQVKLLSLTLYLSALQTLLRVKALYKLTTFTFFYCRRHYTVSQKKLWSRTLATTLSNLNRFQQITHIIQ